MVPRGHHGEREDGPHYRQYRDSGEGKSGVAWPWLTRAGSAAGSSYLNRVKLFLCNKGGSIWRANLSLYRLLMDKTFD